MAFIEKQDPVVMNIKLTSKGRELLANGELKASYFRLGDSEIDYNLINKSKEIDSNYNPTNSQILRPIDINPQIISFITKDLSGDTDNIIENIPENRYEVQNKVDELGFFTKDENGFKFKTDVNHIKQPDLMVNTSGVTGGDELTIKESPNYGARLEKPEIDDYLLVRWSISGDTTGYTLTEDEIPLFYKIVGVDGDKITVDRKLPDFSGNTSHYNIGVMVLYNKMSFSGDTVFNMSSTEYLDASILTFLSNCQSPTIIYPHWNLSIIFTEDIIGIDLENEKRFIDFKSSNMGGFVSYIQNQNPIYKTLGVIHYTNQSPANTYGEGFYGRTAYLELPLIRMANNDKIGLKLTTIGAKKELDGLKVKYYDLGYTIDNEIYIVGKVFPDMKIFVIEDQELLYALSYKSNRSWTLPNYTLDFK